MSYISSMGDVLEQASGLMAEAFANIDSIADATQQGELINNELKQLQDEFRQYYDGSNGLILSIRKSNYDYGESLMNKLNNFSSRYNTLYKSLSSITYVEDLQKKFNDFATLTAEMQTFYNELLSTSKLSPAELAKKQPPGFFGNIESLINTVVIAGVVLMGAKVFLPMIQKKTSSK